MRPFRRILSTAAARVLPAAAFAIFSTPAARAAVNPDLSALGQLRAGWTDDPGAADPEEPTLALGEAEFILTAPLNPYLKGFFTLAAGEEGVGLEEAYAEALRGLRYGLGLKAGQYRLGFGRLNPVHPHAYPFLDAPRAWSTLLPGGEEGWTEPGAQVSVLLPTPGTWASTFAADIIRAAEFHPDEEETRLGWLGRWNNSFLLGERGALEMGASAATGHDAVAEDLRGYLAGGDLKAKLYLPGGSQLTFQGEGAWRLSHFAVTDSPLVMEEEERFGAYAFVDYRHQRLWNVGALYDQAQRPGDADLVDRSVKAFAGWSLMEESTLLRLGWELFLPEGEDAVQAVSFQFLFTMGPHKPHQF